MLLLLILLGGGLVFGFFAYTWFKLDFLTWLLLVSSPGILAFLLALLDKLRDQFNTLIDDVDLHDDEIRRLIDAIGDARSNMDRAFALSILSFVISVLPCVVDKAGYIVPRFLFSLSTGASFLLIFFLWLFYDIHGEINEFKLWIKVREKELKKRDIALQQLANDYSPNDNAIAEVSVSDPEALITKTNPDKEI